MVAVDAMDGEAVLSKEHAIDMEFVFEWRLGVVSRVASDGTLHVEVRTPSPIGTHTCAAPRLIAASGAPRGVQVSGAGGAETRQATADDCDGVSLANPARLDGVADMASLSELSLPCLMHNLVRPLPPPPYVPSRPGGAAHAPRRADVGAAGGAVPRGRHLHAYRPNAPVCQPLPPDRRPLWP